MLKIGFLFCCDYFNHNKPDPDYLIEYNCVISHGFSAYLFCFESFIEGENLKIKSSSTPTTLIYRGWMLTIEQYDRLYRILSEKGFILINTPKQYKQMHYLPSWYNILEKNTAKSVWSEGIPDVPQQKLFLNKFNHKPLIVKDYVKSRKHEWEEACFIPDSSDAPQALKVIRTFIDRQGVDLVGGIVLREYIPLRIIDHHKKSGMPIANEARIFYYYQKAFAAIKYWSGEQVPNYHEYDFLNKVCDCLDSNFFTIDIAQKVNGEWFIIEAGDGQVSGLQNFAPALFYDGLLKTAFFEHKKAEQ